VFSGCAAVGLGTIPPARACGKENYVAPLHAVGQGLNRIYDYICDNRSDPLSCKALGLLRAPNNRGDRKTDGAQTLGDAVSDTARGSNYENSHFLVSRCHSAKGLEFDRGSRSALRPRGPQHTQ
jgi:hypothetical protein